MHKNTLKSQNWWQLTSIQIGGAICMPILMVGQQIAKQYGFIAATQAIIIGNIILFILGFIYTRLAVDKKVTTIGSAMHYFGNRGALFMGATMLIACTGWFAIQLNLMTLSTLHLLNWPSSMHSIVTLFLGIAITGGALFGIKGINKFADITMPLLLATIGYAFYRAFQLPLTTQPSSSFSLSSCTLVIASTLLVVVDIPTYYRLSRSLKDGWISMTLLYLIATPLIQLAGAFIAAHSTGATIIEIFTQQGGFFWQLWILLFLILAGWTTNNTNLYSAVVTLQTLKPSFSTIRATLFIGAIGTLLACYPLLEHYESTLVFMGILSAAMGAVIIINYIFEQWYLYVFSNTYYIINALAWICGVTVGILHFTKLYALTSSALWDSFLAAATCTSLGIISLTVRKNLL